jgi:3D-(3,5/4)-trihydroxycyclohexane-1,2-dione acylhydrolase (decyclizing)
VTLEELLALLAGYHVEAAYEAESKRLHDEWETEVERIYTVRHTPLPSQGELIGLLNELSSPDGIMVNAAGSMPGDLHKLWRARHPKNFHMEYGNSCMGYEIAGGLGVKMAAPDREVYVIVGDGVTSCSHLISPPFGKGEVDRSCGITAASRSVRLAARWGRMVWYASFIVGWRAGGRFSGRGGGTARDRLRGEWRSLGADVIERANSDDYAAAIKAARRHAPQQSCQERSVRGRAGYELVGCRWPK